MQAKQTSISLIQTKCYRPRILTDFVARMRLFHQLGFDQDNPLNLVAAPAGDGKSTLLASWLDQVE